MPILGVIDSAKSGHLAPVDTGAMFPLGMVSVGSAGAANITFSSIPSTYKHLQLRYFSQNTSADTTVFRVNSDSGNNYALHVLNGDGANTSSGATSTYSYGSFGVTAGGTANVFATGIVDFLDYANTNKYKTIRGLSGRDYNGSGNIQLRSSLWQSTSAITSITVTTDSSYNFTQYTSFALYGIL